MNRNLLLAVLSGLLLWAAWPPHPYTTVLLFVAFVPMLVAMEQIIRSNGKNKGKRIFWTTFLGFFIWNTLSIYWVYNSIKTIGAEIAVPIAMIPFSLGPLLMSAACWCYFQLRQVTTRGRSLAGLVCFWIAYELLHQSWDLAFPWMTLGNGFAVTHKWVQWYEYTGVYGGTIWIWTVNILAFLIYDRIRHRANKTNYTRQFITVALVILLPVGFSFWTYAQYQEQKNPANIVVVQPNVDPYDKAGLIPVQTQLNTLIHLSDSLGQPNTEFFIWPETAIAENTDEDRIWSSPHFAQIQRFLNKYKNGNVLTGIESFKLYNHDATPSASPTRNPNEFYDVFNAAVNIENSVKVQFYHKSKLVPGVEQMPFGNAFSFLKPVFAHLGGSTGGYGKQDKPSVFYSQSGIGAAPVICYESIWGAYVGEYVKQGAQFIAIITNDGWWENTSGKDQHLEYAKLRAIETRRWVCRSANTGISAFINQRGDLVQQTEWWQPAVIKADINLNDALTFYVNHGDYLARTGSLFAVCGLLFIGFKRYKKADSKPV